MLVQFIWMGMQFVISLPMLIPAALYLFGLGGVWGWVTLALGIVYGSAALVAGIRIGGRWLDKRAPEVLLAVSVNK